MKRLKYILPAFALITLTFSCKPELEEISSEVNSELDLSHYVAFGDYNTAGYTNGGVNRESQTFAYPNILAQQFARSGVSAAATFEQPYFSSGTQMLQLNTIQDGVPVITGTEEMTKFLTSACNPTPSSIYERYSNSSAQTFSIQNFGVPGLKVSQIRKSGLGNEVNKSNPANFNPYFERLLPVNDNSTYQIIAGRTRPRFFTLWVGMSDIISYATTGATCGNLPSPSQYRVEVSSLLDTLSKITKQPNNKYLSTRKGIICNLPTIHDFGFIGLADPIKLQTSIQAAAQDNNLFIWVVKKRAQFVPGYDTVKISFDDNLLPKALKTLRRVDPTLDKRTVNGNDVIIPHGLSKINPLDNSEVFDATETGETNSRITEYNTEIEGLLENSKVTPATLTPYSNMVILGDMKELFSSLNRGIIYNGVKYNTDPIKGGIYSLDNFSLTPRGQAFVANKLIQTMNREINPKAPRFTGFGTMLKEVNVNDYPGLKYP